MWFMALKKAGFCLAVSFILWLVADCFVTVRAYSGYLAAFMGACFLLAAWIQYMKSKGTDIFRGLRRRKQPEVPYYLRGEKVKKTRLGIFGNRHTFDDDLDENADIDSADLDEAQRRRINAAAFLVTGLLLIVWSQTASSFFAA